MKRLITGFLATILGLTLIGLPWGLHRIADRSEGLTLLVSALVTVAFGIGLGSQAIQSHRAQRRADKRSA